jgi:hypothetical protein
VNIARDGESVRILGARVGNKVNDNAIWTPTIEKINSSLERWDRGHPTLEMRRHIVQMTIGSMTQYLAQVNGMPKSVEKQLIRLQREFMWSGSKSSPVQREMLLAPISSGGKNMFDLTARNQAIQVMKLKSYLELDPSKRAAWCYVVDARLAKHDLKSPKVDKGAHINPFLQTWSPKLSELTCVFKEMMKCALKLGVKFQALDPTKMVLMELPLWHHLGEDPRETQLNNTARCRCLRNNHAAINIGHAVEISARLSSAGHLPDPECACYDCVEDRAFKGCRDPHGCANMAQTRLDRLLPESLHPVGPSTEHLPTPVGRGRQTSGHTESVALGLPWSTFP